MKLFLLEPLGDTHLNYDSNFGFVISAKTEITARELANNESADEGGIWCDPALSSCVVIGTSNIKVEKIVLKDYNAG